MSLKSVGQELEILNYFRRITPDSNRTQRELRAVFKYEQGSISRALTNLTDRGKLEKSTDTVTCRVTGKQVHTWRLARPRPVVRDQEEAQGGLF